MAKFTDLLPGILEGFSKTVNDQLEADRQAQAKLEQQKLQQQQTMELLKQFGIGGQPQGPAPTARPAQSVVGGPPGGQPQGVGGVLSGLFPGQGGAPAATAPSPRQGFGVTGLNVDPIKGGVSLAFGETPTSKSARETKVQVQKDISKRRLQTQEGFRRTSAVFSNLISQFKAKIEAQGGRGGLGPGLVGKARAFFRQPGSAAIKAAETQKNETALALNSVLTGQNRVIRGVVRLIQETLPGQFDSPEFAKQLATQSLNNAFGLLMSMNRGELTRDVLDGFNTPDDVKAFLLSAAISPEELKIRDAWIQQILATPTAARATPGFNAKDPFVQSLEAQGFTNIRQVQ